MKNRWVRLPRSLRLASEGCWIGRGRHSSSAGALLWLLTGLQFRWVAADEGRFHVCNDTAGVSAVFAQVELSDLDADQCLLAWPGTSLVVFTSAGCGACRHARAVLPGWPLPIDRLCWIDAQHSGGLVQRYAVFHLPALFIVRDGQLGTLAPVALRLDDLVAELKASLAGPLEELP